jgi:hypothetical protein
MWYKFIIQAKYLGGRSDDVVGQYDGVMCEWEK